MTLPQRKFNSRGPKFPIPTDGYWAWRVPAPRLSKREIEKNLDKVRTVSLWLDNIPGSPIPIGLDGILGLIPQVGDFIGMIAALYQVYLSLWFGIPIWMIVRMLINVTIDFFIGLIPAVGDVLDIIFKANTYNFNLLEDWLILEGVLGGDDRDRQRAGTGAGSSRAR